MPPLMRHEGIDVDALIVDEETRPKHERRGYPKPSFEVIEASTIDPRVNNYRDWRLVTEALLADALLFMPEAELTGDDVRYLRNRFRRQKLAVKLHVQREIRDGIRGRLVWVDK